MTETEIEKLLRQEHASECPRPGLAQRIQANLPSERPQFAFLRTGSLAALTCLAAGWAFFLSQAQTSDSEIVETKEPVALKIPHLTPPQITLIDPLERELAAFETSAKDTARFLISRFPSLPSQG